MVTQLTTPKQIVTDDTGKRFITQSGPQGPAGAIGPAGPDGNVQIVADYTALRALTSGTYGHTQVRGSGSATTGLLGLFAWDSVSSATDDGGTIIKPSDVGSGAGRWKRIYEGDVLVRWFGAVGDGVGDDTAAVQAAINAGIAAGKRIVFDQPAHKITAELDVVGDNVHLFSACKTRLFIDPGIAGRPYLLAVGDQTLYTGLTVHALPQTTSGNPTAYPVGTRSVTLNTAGDASNYAAGDWAWIRADNCTTAGGTGQPIAELLQIESANAGTGVVTFKAPTTKRYVAGGTYPFGLAKATAYVHADILIDGLWLDNTRHRGLQVFNVVNLEVRNCKFTGVSASSGRGRNFHFHHNEYDITTDAVAPATVRGYFVAVDTGHSGLHFHDNTCTGHGNNWCHINEGQSHVRIHDNVFRLPTSDPNGGIGSGYTDAVWPVIGIGHISWDVQVLNNRIVNTPSLVNDSGTTLRSDAIATTLASGPYNQVGDHFGVLIEGNRIEGTVAGECIDIASLSPVRILANTIDLVSSGGFPLNIAAVNLGSHIAKNRIVVLAGTGGLNFLNNGNVFEGNIFGSTDPAVASQIAITPSTAARLTTGHIVTGNIAQTAWTFTGTGIQSARNTGIPNTPPTVVVSAGGITPIGSAAFGSANALGTLGVIKLADSGTESCDLVVGLSAWPAGYRINLWYCSDATGGGNTYTLNTFCDQLVSGSAIGSTRISATNQLINETTAAVPTSVRIDNSTPYVPAADGLYHIRSTRTIADTATTAMDIIAVEFVPQ